MIGVLYTTLLFAIVAYVLLRGGAAERIAVATLMLGSVSTYAVYHYFGRDFTALKVPMLLNEAAVLAVLLTLGLRSKRFWPMPVASLQIVTFLSLLTPFFGHNIVSHGLGVAQGIWAYPQLLLIVIGVIRLRSRHGPMRAI